MKFISFIERGRVTPFQRFNLDKPTSLLRVTSSDLQIKIEDPSSKNDDDPFLLPRTPAETAKTLFIDGLSSFAVDNTFYVSGTRGGHVKNFPFPFISKFNLQIVFDNS